MAENILTLFLGVFILIFGIILTAAFSGIRFIKRNHLILLGFFAFSGSLQLAAILLFGVDFVWKIYPLITHLPLVLLLCLVFHKSVITTLIATLTAYLCCQPSKWLSMLAYEFTGNTTVELVTRICWLIILGVIALVFLSRDIAALLTSDSRVIYIFGTIPVAYYVFDYITAMFPSLLVARSHITTEFMAVVLAAAHVIFCGYYNKLYQENADAQRKEQIIDIVSKQQAKEINAVKKSVHELQLFRHDMRMLLGGLAVSIENNQTETALKMIEDLTNHIDGTKLARFCSNDIVNYILSDYNEQCANAGVPFTCTIALEELPVDEILFASILSNALDNALNAQAELPAEQRWIRLMLKNSDNKVLLSVRNPVAHPVIFADGLPVARKAGHGYGTQSIRYMTERLGGNCQFSMQDGNFLLRVVL